MSFDLETKFREKSRISSEDESTGNSFSDDEFLSFCDVG